MSTQTTFNWRRTLVDPDTHQRLGSISYAALPKYPHDSLAHDRELVESYFGMPVQTMSDWHWYGRRFTMADGTQGRLDVR